MQVLFIQGPEKTATSTLTGILNCHPEIFILFETYLGQPMITKYGNQLLQRYPEARVFFRSEEDYGKPVLDFFKYLKSAEPGYSYKYAGTKINSLDPSTTQKKKNHKVFFTVRDVHSWLVKKSVIERYRTDLDVVIPTVEYLRYIVNSAKYNHACHVWMENLIGKNDETIDYLSEYLELDLKPHTDRWWEQFGNRKKEDPKSMFLLSHIHHSSRTEPGVLDTEYEIKQHRFWDEVNMVFDKYFMKTNFESVSNSEISQDLDRIENLKRFAPLPFEQAYNRVRSIRLGHTEPEEVYFVSETNSEGYKKSILLKIIERARRVIEIGFNNYHIG